MLDSLSKSKSFYFSFAYDLTNCFQNNFAQNFDLFLTQKKQKNHHTFFYRFQPQKRFYINFEPLENLKKIEASDYITPIISGFIKSSSLILEHENESIKIVLISRRERNRLGMRFWCRGADIVILLRKNYKNQIKKEGNAGNFVETEQIFEIKRKDSTKIISFVQIRGSMPFVWQQNPDLRCVPRVKISPDNKKNVEVFEKHINSLNLQYGLIIILNLIDRRGIQKKLGEIFEEILKKSQVDNFVFLMISKQK